MWFTDYLKPTVGDLWLRKKDLLQSITAHWQCIWVLKSSDGDVQRDCCFHTCCVLSCVQLFVTSLTAAYKAPLEVHGDSQGKNTGVGCHDLLQGIFPTQGSNTGLLYCRRILYCLSHQGSPRILEWVAYPFAKGSSQATSQTGVSCIAGSSLPAELPGKPPHLLTHIYPETH